MARVKHMSTGELSHSRENETQLRLDRCHRFPGHRSPRGNRPGRAVARTGRSRSNSTSGSAQRRRRSWGAAWFGSTLRFQLLALTAAPIEISVNALPPGGTLTVRTQASARKMRTSTSTPSSPPNRPVRARAWAFRSPATSWKFTAGPSGSPTGPRAAPASLYNSKPQPHQNHESQKNPHRRRRTERDPQPETQPRGRRQLVSGGGTFLAKPVDLAA